MSADSFDPAASAVSDSKKRDSRAITVKKACSLVGNRLPVLQSIVECGVLTKAQICRFTEIPDRQVYDAVEALQDGGLIRSLKDFSELLEQPGVRAGRDFGLSHGRTRKVFLPTRAGVMALVDRDLYDRPNRHLHRMMTGTTAVVPHEVQVREARVRMEEWKRLYPHHVVEGWLDGSDAKLPRGVADALVTYWAVKGKAGRFCAVEVDRRSEKKTAWMAKRDRYEATLGAQDRVEVSGSTFLWADLTVLVITPDTNRTAWISDILEPMEFAHRFRITEAAALTGALPGSSIWHVPGNGERLPFIPEKIL